MGARAYVRAWGAWGTYACASTVKHKKKLKVCEDKEIGAVQTVENRLPLYTSSKQIQVFQECLR